MRTFSYRAVDRPRASPARPAALPPGRGPVARRVGPALRAAVSLLPLAVVLAVAVLEALVWRHDRRDLPALQSGGVVLVAVAALAFQAGPLAWRVRRWCLLACLVVALAVLVAPHVPATWPFPRPAFPRPFGSPAAHTDPVVLFLERFLGALGAEVRGGR